mgnify:CR=1 FL=1
MGDYSFLKTGFSMIDGENGINDNELKMIQVILKIFQEDSLITAGKYAIGSGRTNVTSKDMQKALMYQAQNFFDQGCTLEERFNEYMSELNEEDEGEEGEDEGEEDEGEEDESEEDNDEKVIEEESEKFKQTVSTLDAIYEKWNTWEPNDPIQILIKKSIDNVSLNV